MEPTIITPAYAARLLTRQVDHDHPGQLERISRFATLMRGGYWVCSGRDPVLFDARGQLIDGRCRLAAVAVAEMPVMLHLAGWHFGPFPGETDKIA